MKKAPDIVGLLLGLAFVAFGLDFFVHFLPDQPPPGNPAAAAFAGAMYQSGYLAFVKVLEITGGVLVAIPMTRNYGLLVLGPIIVNILCFNTFLTGGKGLFSLPVLLIVLPAAFLLWSERKAFSALVPQRKAPANAPSREEEPEEGAGD
jgi:uncharacterized membrane protein YphA (DoxX/SURF4 family)